MYTRLSGAIPHRTVQHAINVIIDHIAKDLVDDQVITARHFGTLSPYFRPGHQAHDLSTGEVRQLESSRSVKFHPHESFLLLLRDREDRFREKISAKNMGEEKK